MSFDVSLAVNICLISTFSQSKQSKKLTVQKTEHFPHKMAPRVPTYMNVNVVTLIVVVADLGTAPDPSG